MSAPNLVKDSAPSKAARFVEYVIERSQQDKGFAARLRRADNPATEYQSWELLAAFKIPLEFDYPKLAYQTVAASIARADITKNGKLDLGQAIAACYEDGKESEQAKSRLRRLLACEDGVELCRILRGLLSLIDSKVGQALNYEKLLQQLLNFGFEDSRQRVRAQWTRAFYGYAAESHSSEEQPE